MNGENPRQANSNGVDIAPAKRQPKGPEDGTIVQIKKKNLDALKLLKQYPRETNKDALDRIISAAIAAKNANQEVSGN